MPAGIEGQPTGRGGAGHSHCNADQHSLAWPITDAHQHADGHADHHPYGNGHSHCNADQHNHVWSISDAHQHAHANEHADWHAHN